jgi:DNA polymerase-3 subunit beta
MEQGMELEIQKNDLLKALAAGQNIIERKSNVPILGYVHLKAHAQQASLSFTNLNMALVYPIPATVQQEGEICLPAQLIYDIVRKLPSTHPIQLKLQLDTLQTHIQSGPSHFILSGLGGDEFPQLTSIEVSHKFTLPASHLQFLLDQTKPFVHTEESYFVLGGIYLHQDEANHQLRTVSTDSHRLAQASIPSPDLSSPIPGVIIGKKTVQEIRRLLDESNSQVTLGLSAHRIELRLADPQILYSSRLVEGNFPQYQDAFSQFPDQVLTASTKHFLEVVDRIATLLDESAPFIRLNIGHNQLELSAVNPKRGAADEILVVNCSVENPITICLNAQYLLDVLRVLKSHELEFVFSNPDSMILIRPLWHAQKQSVPDSEELYVLMPLIG